MIDTGHKKLSVRRQAALLGANRNRLPKCPGGAGKPPGGDLAISGILAYNRTPRQLVAERNYIESRHGLILALIETRAAEPAVDWRPDIDGRLPEELADRESEIYSEIAQALPLQLVYWATWSSDGHHGLRGLDSQKGHKGYQTDPKPVTRSSDGLRELRCGQSVDELLVLRCRVPKGRKRVCDIAFYKSAMLANRGDSGPPCGTP